MTKINNTSTALSSSPAPLSIVIPTDTTINISARKIGQHGSGLPRSELSGKVRLGGNCVRDTALLTTYWDQYRKKLGETESGRDVLHSQSSIAEVIGRSLSSSPRFNVHYVNQHTLDELSRADGWQDMPREMFQKEGDVGASWAKIQKSRAVTSVAE